MAAFQKQAREDNWTDDEIETVIAEATSQDYRHLMAVLELYCEPDKENESS